MTPQSLGNRLSAAREVHAYVPKQGAPGLSWGDGAGELSPEGNQEPQATEVLRAGAQQVQRLSGRKEHGALGNRVFSGI